MSFKLAPGAVALAALLVSFATPVTAWPQRDRTVVWTSPGRVERLDLAGGPGGSVGAPKAPFTFLEEDTGGTNPKIKVRDARGVEWGVKWGEEVNSEVFASRLAWAVGYFVEPSYFVAKGKIDGVSGLDRAKKFVGPDGTFSDARFERKDKGVTKLGDEQSWRWDDNPFVGTKELDGLKVMMMLVSNWDSKDQRDAGRGSNTKLFVINTRAGKETRYVVSDWGGTMGKWGGFFRRAKWDCDGYAGQNDEFVKGVKEGMVEFGYSGQHTGTIKDGIPVAHVKWLMTYLGKLTDNQIRAALRASGASPGDEECFARAVRGRISALQAIR
ncbi:MAG: hypothetical protein IT175_18160 [Acidobacteria bacterium]|nr:hypothetical protein [Acidobacteriota bacterium]